MENSAVTNPEGAPQDSRLYRLFGNLNLKELERAWISGPHSTGGHIICYADHFIILGTGDMIPEIQNLRKITKSLHLSLNEEKTDNTEAENGFDFLGCHFVLLLKGLTTKKKDFH